MNHGTLQTEQTKRTEQIEPAPFSAKAFDRPLYKGSSTTSQYIESFDGTRIAVDVTLPVAGSGVDARTFPAILIANRSGRRNLDDPEIALGHHLVPYGYAFVSFELRGCGVSFGVNDSFGNDEHCRDLISVIDWVYSQDWCSKKIGLLGCSNRAYIQLCTAALNPRHLSAITPVVAVSDFYYQNYPNGVSAIPDFRMGTFDHKMTKEEFLKTVTPVDADKDGSMAYKAFTECQYDNNKDFFDTLLIPNLNRDSAHPNYGSEPVFMTIPPYGKLDEFFGRKEVRQHQFIGQLESGTLGQLAQFLDFGGSICLGPWTHGGGCVCRSAFANGTLDLVNAYRTWYDSSLKGMDNGFTEMPPVSYYMFHATPGKEWRFSESWPPENEVRTTLYFDNRPSGTCASVNDGSLTLEKPDASFVDYKVRDDIRVFKGADTKSHYNRSELLWDGDMNEDVDQKGLTFTSAPLFAAYDNEMAGCISVELWISCTAKDVDLIVYAEEVRPDGTSRYIKDGVMRASHRTFAPNPAWERMGATWHTSMTCDVEKCLDEGLGAPTLLKFAIDPIAYHFQPKSRLRITVTCANNAAFQHYMYRDGLPTLTLYTGGEHASNISVPFLEPEYNTYVGTLPESGKPATLYVFNRNCYLNGGGTWHRYPNDNTFEVDGNTVFLGKERTEFIPFDMPRSVPHLPSTQVPSGDPHPFPTFRRQLVSTEPVASREYTLFVPGKKNLYLDVFKNDKTGDSPCIIYIHGYGTPYCSLPPQVKLLYENDYAIAAIDIRNYPPNRFPDYINDAKGAIRYLRANAGRFGINPEKFATYGFSLGGNTSLMLGLTGDNPGLEGHVGKNKTFSSRVQACVAGFAWSSLLDMGKDIAEEFENHPDIRKERIAMTDGAFSPSSEVIAFAGEGKGLGVLREYLDNGCQPDNALYNQKLQEAYDASPVNAVNPSVPPIALFGGHGMECINIAFKQSLRTFEALNDVDALVFLYGNTQGEYGEKPETMLAIKAFYDKHLKERPQWHVISVTADSPSYVHDYVTRPLSRTARLDADGLWTDAGDICSLLAPAGDFDLEVKDGEANLCSLCGENVQKKYYEKYKTIIIKLQDTSL